MKKIALISTIVIALFTGCKKIDFDLQAKGESNGVFKLLTPSSGTSLALNSATPAVTVDITWSASAPGVNTAPTYKWVAALKTGDINAPILEIPANNAGKDTKLTLTYLQLDQALASKGIAAAAEADLIWSVVADNGSTKLRSTDVFSIKIARFGDGATPFNIYGPISSTTIVELDPGSTTKLLVFKWQKSTPAVAANAIRYKLQMVNELNPFAAPFVLDVASDNAGVDTTKTFTHKAFSDSLTAHGFTDMGLVSQLKWRAVATSGNFSLASNFSNILYVIREIKMYMVGSFQGWNPANGMRMIPDNRTGLLNNMFYAYIFLPANTEFKFLQGLAWGVPDYGDGGGGVLNPGGANIQVAVAGYYRVSMNKTTLRFNIMTGRMGFVGGATGAGWNPPGVFPTYSLGNSGTNLFVGLTNFTSGGWKLIDNNQWNNGSNAVDETRSYGTSGGDGSTLEVNGSNFNDYPAAGRYRVIWDGRDVKNVKYFTSPGTEMRVVGDGMNQAGVNDWDPPTSPQMFYAGNGVWTLTIALKANKDIKFLAGNNWGAFDYEDNSGGSQATGTPRPIKWEGGNNFKTPTVAGTYTITLNENLQTMTIN